MERPPFLSWSIKPCTHHILRTVASYKIIRHVEVEFNDHFVFLSAVALTSAQIFIGSYVIKLKL